MKFLTYLIYCFFLFVPTSCSLGKNKLSKNLHTKIEIKFVNNSTERKSLPFPVYTTYGKGYFYENYKLDQDTLRIYINSQFNNYQYLREGQIVTVEGQVAQLNLSPSASFRTFMFVREKEDFKYLSIENTMLNMQFVIKVNRSKGVYTFSV